MRLVGSTEQVAPKDKNGENMPKLEIVNLKLMHWNIVNNNYQQATKVLFMFVPDKQFRQLISVSTYLLTMLKTTNLEFSFIEVWFTGQDNRLLEIKNSMNITLIIGTKP